MGREGVAQGVGRGPLRDPGPADGTLHQALEHGLVQVVPAPLAGVPVHVETGRGDGGQMKGTGLSGANNTPFTVSLTKKK